MAGMAVVPALRLGRACTPGALMQFEERTIAGLRVRIDRTLCVAFETCVDFAPEVFRLDAEGVITFIEAANEGTRERLIEACKSCPVDALSLFDADGADLLNNDAKQ